MNNFLKKLAALINVKTLVTFAVTAVFCVLSLQRFFNAETVMSVVATVIAFYFGTQHEAKNAANGGVSGTVDGGSVWTPTPTDGKPLFMTSGYIAPTDGGTVAPDGAFPVPAGTPNQTQFDSAEPKSNLEDLLNNGQIYIEK
jgi:hypothetical protein